MHDFIAVRCSKSLEPPFLLRSVFWFTLKTMQFLLIRQFVFKLSV